MYLIHFSTSNSLSLDLARRRVAEFGETLELLSQAQVSWQDPETLLLRGPNVDGLIVVREGQLEVRFRLGVTLSVVGDTMAATLVREIELLSRSEVTVRSTA